MALTDSILEAQIELDTPPPNNASPSLDRALHLASFTCLFAVPALILLPPRKLDLYTFSLGAAFVASVNHQTHVRTGGGVLQWLAASRTSQISLPRGRLVSSDIANPRQEENSLGVLEKQRFGISTAQPSSDYNNGIRFEANVHEPLDRWPTGGIWLGADGRARITCDLRDAESLGSRIRLPHDSVGHSSYDSRIDDDSANLDISGQAPIERKQERGREQVIEAERNVSPESKGIGEIIVGQIWEVWNWSGQAADVGPSGSGRKG